jgi:CubicO group peptidase (beta-lactamase class C family)
MRAGLCLMSSVRGYFAEVLLPILLEPFCAYAQEKSHVAPEQVDRAIREIEKLAQKEIQENALPGLAIAIVFQDKVRYAKGFGVRDVNTKMPVDADTVFQLASVSKSVGSTVVAEMVGEGKSPGTRSSASSIPPSLCSIRG